MTVAVRAGMDFISALDQGSVGRMQRVCAPGATWWVDSGPDRAGGDPVASPGGSGRYPLHGVMDLAEKLRLMRQKGSSRYPNGCRQTPRRVIAGELDCVIEVEGHGVLADGRTYANRYAFVFDVRPDGLITSVREYLDTIHAQEMVGAGSEVPPSVELRGGDPRPPLEMTDEPSEAVRRALALWPALAAGDLDAFEALFHPDATFWTDSGRDRARGRLEGWGDVNANGPFHGRIPIADKMASMRRRAASGAYTRRNTVTPHRLIVDGNLVAIEASGDARVADRAYQNRYLWVVDADDTGIRAVREYCDTLHVAELMGFPDQYQDSPMEQR